MRTLRILWVSVLTLVSVGAASAFMQAAQAGNANAVPVADARVDARHALETRIKKGMTFAAFRRVALAQGWAPILHTPPCLNQVAAALCTQLPELYNTSSGPEEFNQVSYRHLISGEAVSVTATGDIEQWNKPGEENEVFVDSWRFSAGEVRD